MIMRSFIKDALILSILPLLVGLVFAFASQSWGQRHRAEATLLYGTGPDYMTQAWSESDGESSRWSLERILNTEAQMLNADELKHAVLRNIDLERLLGRDAKSTTDSGSRVFGWLRDRLLPQEVPSGVAAVQVLRNGLEIKPVKNSGIIHVTFAHADKALSVDVLRHLLDEYVKLRKDVLQVDKVAPLTREIERQQAAYQDLLQQRTRLANEHRVGDVEQDGRGLHERQSTLIGEAGQLARQLASTDKQLELHESLGSLGPEKLAELNGERAGLLAAKASVETQLGQVRDQLQRIDQASSALGALDQQIEARKAAIGKLQEMVTAAEISSSLNEAITSPRILEAPRSEDAPVSLPPLAIAGLAAVASLIALIAVRVLGRTQGTIAMGRPSGVSHQRTISSLPLSDGDQPSSQEIKQKGIRNIAS
jgi:uncharacterized protein involved in exopolysaccharide biosynthesis